MAIYCFNNSGPSYYLEQISNAVFIEVYILCEQFHRKQIQLDEDRLCMLYNILFNSHAVQPVNVYIGKKYIFYFKNPASTIPSVTTCVYHK